MADVLLKSAVILLVLSACSGVQALASCPEPFWQDEFDGETLDPAKAIEEANS